MVDELARLPPTVQRAAVGVIATFGVSVRDAATAAERAMVTMQAIDFAGQPLPRCLLHNDRWPAVTTWFEGITWELWGSLQRRKGLTMIRGRQGAANDG